jgi:hypothetical protein
MHVHTLVLLLLLLLVFLTRYFLALFTARETVESQWNAPSGELDCKAYYSY